MVRLLLASRAIPDLAAIAGARGRRAVLVPDAADPLDDSGIPAEVEQELRRADFDVARLALAASTAQQVRSVINAADVVAISGGDPFHLALSLTSPFTPPPGLDLTGLGLVDVLVLPHDDHPGRHDRHLAAQGRVRGPCSPYHPSRRRRLPPRGRTRIGPPSLTAQIASLIGRSKQQRAGPHCRPRPPTRPRETNSRRRSDGTSCRRSG